MKNVNPLTVIGILTLAAVVIIFFFGPAEGIGGLAALFLKLVGILFVLGIAILATIVALVIRWQRNRKPKGASAEEKDSLQTIKKGKSHLAKLRSTGMQIRNKTVRTQCSNVCDSIANLLNALKDKPEKVPKLRQFFNYYLPTFGEILKKYRMLEKNDMTTPEIDEKVMQYLRDIDRAMRKQYESLFSNVALDLTVEMEAMQIDLHRDGLIEEKPGDQVDQDDEDDGLQPITLTL